MRTREYRGYYIDHVSFHSKEEIDEFIRDNMINHYRTAVQEFVRDPDYAISIYVDRIAEDLHRQCGVSWEEIAAIEIETMKQC